MTEIDIGYMVRNNRQIFIRMEQFSNNATAAKGLTAAQAHTLRYILQHSEQGTSLTEIQQEFGYSKATLSHILKNLREKGYIRTECCSSDDRRKILFATEKAEQIENFLEEAIRTTQGQMYQCFSQKELITLDQLQKKMLQNLSTLVKQKEASKL